jgi:tetratricopeptide (TPR) repeat protein
MERLARIEMLIGMLEREPDDLFLNYALGVEYMSDNRLKDAEAQFKKVLAMDNQYIAAYYQLGKLHESASNPAEALGYYKSGLEKAKLKKDNKAINEFGEAIFMLEED